VVALSSPGAKPTRAGARTRDKDPGPRTKPTRARTRTKDQAHKGKGQDQDKAHKGKGQGPRTQARDPK